jgi:hypothetical protein
MIPFLNRNDTGKWPHTCQIEIVGRNHILNPPLGIENTLIMQS